MCLVTGLEDPNSWGWSSCGNSSVSLSLSPPRSLPLPPSPSLSGLFSPHNISHCNFWGAGFPNVNSGSPEACPKRKSQGKLFHLSWSSLRKHATSLPVHSIDWGSYDVPPSSEGCQHRLHLHREQYQCHKVSKSPGIRHILVWPF